MPSPRAVFFDMDGVLFDSMPAHAKSWETVAKQFGFDLPYEEVFMINAENVSLYGTDGWQ